MLGVGAYGPKFEGFADSQPSSWADHKEGHASKRSKPTSAFAGASWFCTVHRGRVLLHRTLVCRHGAQQKRRLFHHFALRTIERSFAAKGGSGSDGRRARHRHLRRHFMVCNHRVNGVAGHRVVQSRFVAV